MLCIMYVYHVCIPVANMITYTHLYSNVKAHFIYCIQIRYSTDLYIHAHSKSVEPSWSMIFDSISCSLCASDCYNIYLNASLSSPFCWFRRCRIQFVCDSVLLPWETSRQDMAGNMPSLITKTVARSLRGENPGTRRARPGGRSGKLEDLHSHTIRTHTHYIYT